MGNELDLHVYRNCDGVEPEALGRDMVRLSALLAKLFADWTERDRPRLAGPDIAAFTGTTGMRVCHSTHAHAHARVVGVQRGPVGRWS